MTSKEIELKVEELRKLIAELAPHSPWIGNILVRDIEVTPVDKCSMHVGIRLIEEEA
jgi:hypothetical protein